MSNQQFISIIILLAATIISSLVTIYSWRRRSTIGITYFTWLMLGICFWLLGNTLEVSRSDFAGKLFWANVEMAAIATIPVFAFLFALGYTGHTRWLTRRFVGSLFVLPLLTQLLVWTNESHHLFRTAISLDTSGTIPVWNTTFGPAFWLHTIYSYTLLLVGNIVFIQAFIRSSRLYRRQIGIILIGGFVPWVMNILYLFAPGPLLYFDPTPLSFLVTGLVMAWGIFGFRLITVNPIARNNVIENMRDGMIVLDTQDYIVDLNPAAAQLLDCTPEEAIGQAAAHTLSRWPVLVERYLPMSTVDAEIVWNQADQERFFRLLISPLIDDRSRFTGRLFVLHDVTEQKQAEEAYMTLVEQSLQGLAIIGQDGRLVFANPALGQITGHSADELLALHLQDMLKLVHPDDQARVTSGLADGISTLAEPSRSEFRIIDKAGQLRWIEQITSSIQYRGQPALQTAVMDISERKRSEELLRSARDAAESANQAKSTFLANMSHELRTPLAAIIGYSEIMLEQLPAVEHERFGRWLNSIVAAANQLLAIISGILDMSKIEAGKMDLHCENFAVRTLIDNVLETAHPLIARNNNQMQVAYDTTLTDMFADPVKLKQILLNILSNAGKFTKDGVVSLEVRPEMVNNGTVRQEQIVFQIQDTGIGIAPEKLTNIFQPFTQADPTITRKYGGAGLGLAISHHFCQMMGGQISVTSAVGEGTTFTVKLPRSVDSF